MQSLHEFSGVGVLLNQQIQKKFTVHFKTRILHLCNRDLRLKVNGLIYIINLQTEYEGID